MIEKNDNMKAKMLMEKIHPLSKILFFILLLSIILSIPESNFVKQIIPGTLVLMLIFLHPRKVKGILRSSFMFYPVIFILTMMFPFKGLLGETQLEFPVLVIYKSGLNKFLAYNIRMMTILLYVNLFSSTTTVLELIYALEKIKIPKKVITILFLVNRYIALLKNDVQKSMHAFKSRHIKLDAKNYLRNLGYLTVSIFLGLFKRNEEIYIAMSSRGFKGELSFINTITWTHYDLVFTLLTFLFFFITIVF